MAVGDFDEIVEWLFTTKRGTFGLVAGWANVTGWALLAFLFVMALCALPVVRRKGFFEVRNKSNWPLFDWYQLMVSFSGVLLDPSTLRSLLDHFNSARTQLLDLVLAARFDLFNREGLLVVWQDRCFHQLVRAAANKGDSIGHQETG